MISAHVEKTFCPPNNQLEFSSKSGKSRRSARIIAMAVKTIDGELQMLQANAEAAKAEADRRDVEAKAEADRLAAEARFEAEIIKKQAII